MPLEAWAGTMASEPKGTEPKETKSSRAQKKGEEQQSPKSRRRAAEPQIKAMDAKVALPCSEALTFYLTPTG